MFIIHADANYTYHVDGKRHSADKEALDKALETARKATHGEVFIFHQKREKNRFLFFPQKNREWYQFRGGALIAEGKYSPKKGGIEKEAEIYKNRAAAQSSKKMLFYFGHEIPSKTSLVYHQSRPESLFNTRIFTEGISKFEDRFSLLMLSTCNNGNPLMAGKLIGKADFLVASPRNLHLSYLDTDALQLLESKPEMSAEALADSLARQSFERLSGQLQTMVTTAVYDLDIVSAYITDYAADYSRYLDTVEQKSLFTDNADCNALPVFRKSAIPEKGVHLYFKPPAFGKEASLENHSVWGCKQ